MRMSNEKEKQEAFESWWDIKNRSGFAKKKDFADCFNAGVKAERERVKKLLEEVYGISTYELFPEGEV